MSPEPKPSLYSFSLRLFFQAINKRDQFDFQLTLSLAGQPRKISSHGLVGVCIEKFPVLIEQSRKYLQLRATGQPVYDYYVIRH